jgi:translocation and assembly module TamB
MIGVKHAIVRGKLGVRPNSFDIYDTRTDFGSSNMYVELVSIGFDNNIKLVVPPQRSKLNLADVTPLVDIPMAGQAELDVNMSGPGGDPLLTGNLKVQGFEFGGFPLGDCLDCACLELVGCQCTQNEDAIKVSCAAP